MHMCVPFGCRAHRSQKMSDSLGVDLWMFVSHRASVVWELNPGPIEEHPVFLATEHPLTHP